MSAPFLYCSECKRTIGGRLHVPHAPDCPQRPPGVREHEELQRGSHPPTWDPATGAQVEALRSEVTQLRDSMREVTNAIRGDLSNLVSSAAGWAQDLDRRLAALEARREGESE